MRHDKVITFLKEAALLANRFSKDQSTKVGAMLMDPQDFTQLTHGYNGMPRGVREDIAERHLRPLKYSFFEHAERNAIFNMARLHLKDSVVLTTGPLRIGCVRALVSVGASEVWAPQAVEESADARIAKELLSDAGVQVYRYDASSIGATSLLHEPELTNARHLRKVTEYLGFTADLAALLAKDPYADATVFLHKHDYTVLARGYSGLPRGAQDTLWQRYEEPARELWVEGSVRNAIYNRMRRDLKGSVALVTATTCGECARALAGVGVTKVYYLEPPADFKTRWGASIDVALNMLDELGIAHQEISGASVAAAGAPNPGPHSEQVPVL